MTREWRELPWSALRDSAHAFTVFIYVRKWDNVFLLLRASSPPKEIAANKILIRTPAEPEGSFSPMRFGFRRFFFAGKWFALLRLPQACFPVGSGEFSFVHHSSHMHDATAIHGHDIIDIVATYPEGIRLSQLMEIVGERYGRSVTFHTCSAMGMDLDGLLAFLEARDKVRIKSGVVFPGGSPACEH